MYLPEGDVLPIVLNSNGIGEVEFTHTTPQYVQIGYNYSTRLFWFTPESTLELTFKSEDFAKDVDLAGDNLPTNIYLNKSTFPFAQINETELGEQDFMALTDSLLQQNLQTLHAAPFDEVFKEKEAKRLAFHSKQTLPSYPFFHRRIAKDTTYRASEAYWNALKQAATFEGDDLEFFEYQTFLTEAVQQLAQHEYPNLTGMDRLQTYITHFIPDTRVAEFLVYSSVYAYLHKNGLTGADAYLAAFKKYVSHPKLVKQYTQLYNQVSQLQAGTPSPDFNATDVAGKKYSLADFKGKYVYIDIWATWCGPCKKEIPYLAELDEKYVGKDIVFVSISCDTKRDAWEKKVTTDGMKGVQLHFDAKDTFMKDYRITGIPRFILLDKEGNIISADMTRPSDPETVTTLDALVN